MNILSLHIFAAMRICVSVLVFLSVALPASADRKPNVILILSDDLGYADVGFNGRKEWKTPNLDRLARQGTKFTRWYTGAVVCAPSRAVLLTGKYTIHNGVSRNDADIPSEEVTIAEALKLQGYSTALFGKWHQGRPRGGKTEYVHPMDQGFDEFFGFTSATHAWEHFPKELWEGRDLKPSQGYSDTLFANRTIDFIQRKREGPFFVYLAFNAPHFHVEAPEEDVARFRGKFSEKDPANPVNAAYAAAVTRQDAEVGRVMEALERSGLTSNTIVIFSSDHGATFEAGNKGASSFHDSNRPFRGQKRTLWEGGIRVPAIVRWPGHVPSKRTCTAPIHNIDVLPTFLAACGAIPNASWKVDGQNRLDLWEGRTDSNETPYFWEWRSEGYLQSATMIGSKKLVLTGSGQPELFDVVEDPAERRNLAAEYPDTVKDLRSKLTEWLTTEDKARTEYK